MNAALLRARAELRARLASMIALAVLLGLGAGAVLTLTAGARRTDSAYRRFERAYLAADMLVYPAFDSTFASLDFDEVAALPEVVASGRQHFVGTIEQDFFVFSPSEPTLGSSVDRPKMLDGRLPLADSLDEASLPFTLARTKHLRVGSTLRIRFAAVDHSPIPYTLRIVGIEATPGAFPPQFSNSGPPPGIRVSPALFESLRPRVFTLDFLLLRFNHGHADFGRVNDQMSELAEGKVQLNLDRGAQAAGVQRSIHLQAVALRIVGGLVALIGLLVLSQLIARQAALDATDTPTLLAMGMTRREIAASGLWRSAIIGVVGAVIAVVTAFAASPLMPIGTARVAEPSAGLSFDALILGGGAVAVVLVYLALAAVPLWRSTTAARSVSDGTPTISLPARSATVAGLPPPMSMGIRLALETGRDRTAVPVRSSLLSVAIAIVALAAALSFGAGLDHLLDTPHQYGWNWDLHISVSGDTNEQAAEETRVLMHALDSDTEVTAATLVDTPPVRIGDVTFGAIALQQRKGVIEPIVIDGHAPHGSNEIALGARTLRDAHARIGSTVHVAVSAIAGGGADFTVAGTVVVPPNSEAARLGEGGVLPYDGVLRMVPPGFKNLPPLSEIYLRLAPGTDLKKTAARLKQTYGEAITTRLPERPVDLVNFGQVQNLPLLLAGLIAALAAATLVHTLVTAIRRRRRDLAILKMLGFVPRQVRSAVAWQATTFVLASLLIGLPVGIAIGRLIWTLFAHQLGTLAEPVTPSVQLLLTIPGAVLLANMVATVPAVIAGRMRPAPALRAE